MNLELFGIVVILVVTGLLCCAIAQIFYSGYTCLRKCILGRRRGQSGQTGVQNPANTNVQVQQASAPALNDSFNRILGTSRSPQPQAFDLSNLQTVILGQRTAPTSLISMMNPPMYVRTRSSPVPEFSPPVRTMFSLQRNEANGVDLCGEEEIHDTIDLPPSYEEAMRAKVTDPK